LGSLSGRTNFVVNENDDLAQIGSSLPLSEQDESDIVHACMKLDRDCDTRHAEWREESRESYEFVAGHQWDDESMAILREQSRPPVTFNQIGPFFDVVAGAQVNNRQETKYLATKNETAQAAETTGLIADWANDRCDAEDEESEAFRDVLTCGMGWTETRMEYLEDPLGKIIVERIDPMEMRWDPSAQRRNLSDAKAFIRKRHMPIDEVYALWPEARDKVSASIYDDTRGEADEPVQPVRDSYEAGDSSHFDYWQGDRSGLPVFCFEWREIASGYAVVNPQTGDIETLTRDQWNKLGERLGKARDRLKHVRQPRRVWYRAHIAAGVLLDGPQPAPCPEMSSFRPITGKRDARNNTFFGIVRAIKDPQRWANKWLSQSVHIMNTAAKSGWIIEENVVHDVREFENEVAKPGSVQLVRAGALSAGAMKEKTPPPFPSGWQQLLEFAIGSIASVSGINDELRGKVDQEQSGVVEWHRKRAATAMLAPLFDSLRRYHKEQGRLMLYFISHYIPPQRQIRIVGNSQAPRTVSTSMIGDPDGYDVRVDEAPTSPNQKTEVWQFIGPALPTLIQMQLPMSVWTELLRFSPLPESVTEKVIQALQNQPAQPNPEQQKAAAQIQLMQQKGQLQAQQSQQKAQLEAQQSQAEAQREATIAQQKANLEAEIEKFRAEQQMQIEQVKAQNQARLQVGQTVHDTILDHARTLHESRMAQQAHEAQLGMAQEGHQQQLKHTAAMAAVQQRKANHVGRSSPR
jgi:hypothetical protein